MTLLEEFETNHEALLALERQQFKKAQSLFAENAKRNPSHQTLNNLGVFLFEEGFECKNGKIVNCIQRGLRCLLKSSEIKATKTNYSAIAKAYDLRSYYVTCKEKKEMYEKSCYYLQRAQELEYTYEDAYNLIRQNYLLDSIEIKHLSELKRISAEYPCSETARMYLQLLVDCSYKAEGILCINQFRDFLEITDLLMFYTKFEMFEEAYKCCESAVEQFDIDIYTASAIIESCVKTDHNIAAKEYARIFEERLDGQMLKKRQWKMVLSNTDYTSFIRNHYIFMYKDNPPFIDSCYYFGCNMHNTAW